MSGKHDDQLNPAGSASAEPALARWARRKQQARQGVQETEPAAFTPAKQALPAAAPEPRIDARTGKPYDELTDADMPPIESLDADSDLSVFLAKNITPALRMAALSKVFHSTHYNQYCLCAEYADDYTKFTPLGDIVPHDLKATIVREAKQLRERMLELGRELSLEDAEAQVVAERKAGLPRSILPEPAAEQATATGPLTDQAGEATKLA